MDGMELCRLVRERVPEWFPILFLTALDDLQTLKFCQDAGADDYVVKDGSPDDIVASVDYWQRHLQGELKDSERRLSLAQVIVASEKAQP